MGPTATGTQIVKKITGQRRVALRCGYAYLLQHPVALGSILNISLKFLTRNFDITDID